LRGGAKLPAFEVPWKAKNAARYAPLSSTAIGTNFFFQNRIHVVSRLSKRLGFIENLIMHGKNGFVEIFKNFS